MRATITFCLLFLVQLSFAQFLQDVSGRPYLQKASEEYEGSPLLFSAWVKADVTSANGKKYSDMLVNVDILQDAPIFFRDNKVFTFSEGINEFTISDHTGKLAFKRGHLLSPSLPSVFLEVISETPLLLKKSERNLVEAATYGGGNKTYRHAESKVYYAVIDNEYKKISLSKENAQKVFGQRWKEMDEYAKANNISFKSEEGWRQLISFTKAQTK